MKRGDFSRAVWYLRTRGLEGIEFFVCVCLLIVIIPLVITLDTKDWTIDHWKNPWRLERYLNDRWEDWTGKPTLEMMLKEAISVKNTYPNVTWRIRHFISRDFIMADIL